MPRTGLSAEEIKERSIEIAEAKIRQLGFDRVRLVDIARELGVSHVALYKHFPDKAALLDAVSEKWLAAFDAELEGVARGNGPAGDRIVAWFLAYHRLKLEKVRRDPELYRAFDLAAQAMKPFVVRHLEATGGQLQGLVSDAMREGFFRQANPTDVTSLLLELTVSFHHPKLVAERLNEDREDRLQVVLVTLFRALR
ncbi:TetR/AcrR family transcriptional regulator [bacterium]|nr:MAG: TetR/AcrR family transcriptional regulator [bacterium]